MKTTAILLGFSLMWTGALFLGAGVMSWLYERNIMINKMILIGVILNLLSTVVLVIVP